MNLKKTWYWCGTVTCSVDNMLHHGLAGLAVTSVTEFHVTLTTHTQILLPSYTTSNIL